MANDSRGAIADAAGLAARHDRDPGHATHAIQQGTSTP
jgi:hypothetical protein